MIPAKAAGTAVAEASRPKVIAVKDAASRRMRAPALRAAVRGWVPWRGRGVNMGLSFLFGMLLGDFVGGSAVVIGARAVLQSSYSRETESAADRYGVELMRRAEGDPRALGTMLTRLGGAVHPGAAEPAARGRIHPGRGRHLLGRPRHALIPLSSAAWDD